MRKGPLAGRLPLPKTFRWSHIGFQLVGLSWNVDKLGADYADIIILDAAGISFPGYKMNSTAFQNGKLLLRGLRPCSLYHMTVEVVRFKKYVRTYNQFIITACRETTRTPVTEMSSLPPPFNWTDIGPTYITLGWAVAKPPADYADAVILTAGATSCLFFRMNFTAYSDGSLTLGGLTPETTYNVTVEIVRLWTSVHIYTQVITTKAIVGPAGTVGTTTKST
ncbi:unnamed protein product [Taenia asiatica]|uniref:Fibronectin type-III domain-containing protein n=1 Tax=Taenia asiatica TaxID=60517 RepID=A0A0R3WH30_TAEAS|nr:unnamed protein product [Taenia asiatica]